MAVDRHPSRKPTPPRKPPATSTTCGTINKIPASEGKNQGGGDYGFKHELRVHSGGSEMAHHFRDFTSSEGRARSPGREAPNEGTVSRAKRPGDEKSNDEPG